MNTIRTWIIPFIQEVTAHALGWFNRRQLRVYIKLILNLKIREHSCRFRIWPMNRPQLFLISYSPFKLFYLFVVHRYSLSKPKINMYLNSANRHDAPYLH